MLHLPAYGYVGGRQIAVIGVRVGVETFPLEWAWQTFVGSIDR